MKARFFGNWVNTHPGLTNLFIFYTNAQSKLKQKAKTDTQKTSLQNCKAQNKILISQTSQ